MDLVDCFFACLKEAGCFGIEVVVYGVEGYDDGDTVIDVSVWRESGSEAFREESDVCKNARYCLVVFFRLVDLWIVEQFLED